MSYTPHTWVTGETITADKLNNMEGGIANNDTAISGMSALISETFATNKAYSKGDYVIYQNALYRFTANHSAGAWTGTDVTQVVLADEVTDVNAACTNLNNAFSESINRLVALDGKTYIDPDDFELGNISISGTGWTYSSSSTRVRTKEGTTYSLKAGDVIKLSSYTDARFYLGWYANGVYDYKGWLTSDYTVAVDGDYVILICNLTDTTQTSKDALLSLLSIERADSVIKSLTGISNHISTFEDDTFNYIIQFLDVSKKTSGQFYYANNITTGTASGLCTFPPVDVEAGKTYTLVNVRTHFCNFKSGSTITTLDGSDAGTVNKTVTYVPQSNGQLYITGGDSANVMLFDADYRQNNYVFGGFNYKIKTDALGKSVTPENCTFFKECVQYLKSADALSGYWNIKSSDNTVDWSSNDNMKRYAGIKLTKDVAYSFVHVYGYFCLIADSSGNVIQRLTTDLSSDYSTQFTPSADCYAYVSIHVNQFEKAMLCNDTEYLPDEYTEGGYYTYLTAKAGIEEINLHVKTDGTGDYDSVVAAVAFANAQSGTYPINIYIHSGDYDILDELGGDDFISTIADSADERQGLVLKRHNVNLIGVGYVVLRYELPNTVTYVQSQRTSCLNMREYSNAVSNMTLIAKNCRYVIHDETNGGNPFIHRVMKNLRCIHKGNQSGLWEYPTVMGGGAGGGSVYDVINCQFITGTYKQAFSYHSNTNEQASFFNIDGCVGSVNNSNNNGISFRFSYHGTGRTGISVANVKNCSGNGVTTVQAETSGDTNNNIEMYVNGWEDIEPIPVTGNE